MSERILLIDTNGPAWRGLIDAFPVEPLRAEPTANGVRYSYTLGYQVSPLAVASLARRCAVIHVAPARDARKEEA